jgi:hypothetical protein
MTRRDEFVWFNHVSSTILSSFFTGYDTSAVITMERELFNWSITAQNTIADSVLIKGNSTEFYSKWNTWITARQTDGSQTQPQPSSSDAVNINLQIETYTDVLPTFVDNTKWTPLKVSPTKAKQGYLTFFWDNVRSTGINASQESQLDTTADLYYITGTARENEVRDVMNITANLTDNQKVIAEFWAGGPRTITPPGMTTWFWKNYITAMRPSDSITLFSGLDLAIHIFEGSRITWRNKARKVEARPIQEIRVHFAGESTKSWNGNDILGKNWTPYQESDFVTPPFADFPSGHSHFSQAMANTMNAWFGSTIPRKNIKKTDMNLLSPAYNSNSTQSGIIGSIVFQAGNSLIQSGIVPATNQTLSWNTWQEMADSAGMSRLYGGIHCLSANTGSQAIANELHTMLNSVWGFNRS